MKGEGWTYQMLLLQAPKTDGELDTRLLTHLEIIKSVDPENSWQGAFIHLDSLQANEIYALGSVWISGLSHVKVYPMKSALSVINNVFNANGGYVPSV